jgi:hypothetical protein
MDQAKSVHSTPPTNTPIDKTRRRFLTVAAGASISSVGALTVAAMPSHRPRQIRLCGRSCVCADCRETSGGRRPDGWHYQLRATMAAAIEALIKAQPGKAVRA